ncbi:hypothetical protein [Christiangramia sp.]|uniref:hypothetical protein n=1 Tax=Christiangramia sp. TaxID=1931228 RepID=UPI0026276223|nr:hypothetical protein [Christiangramia sp.]
MANILDILLTRTGDRLLEKSQEITKLDSEVFKKSFVYSLPSLLIIYSNKSEFKTGKHNNLIALIENEDIIQAGKQNAQSLTDPEIQVFLQYAEILDVEKKDLKDILYLSLAILTSIISEMMENSDLKFQDIIKTLSGLETKNSEAYLKVLLKNAEDPNIIDNREEILLGRKNKDDDQSLLGGYTGGR